MFSNLFRSNDKCDFVDSYEPVNITSEVFYGIKNTIGGRPAESGGLLGSTDGGNTIDLYAFDYTAKTASAVYVPNTDMLNPILASWDSHEYQPVGIIHSHPEGCTYPSTADMNSADTYIRAVPSFGGKMEMPIVQVGKNRENFKILWYTVIPTKSGLPRLIPRKVCIDGDLVSDPYDKSDSYRTCIVPEEELFQRIDSVFPLEVARKKTVVAVGVGGAREFLCDLARMDIGRFVLIDGDTIEPPNVATQGVNADEMGLLKVDACAEAIARVNPYAEIIRIPRMLDDRISDREFVRMIGTDILKSSQDVLLCALTDNFFANARVAQLAVKYGTPYLQGLVYQYGTVAEIVFSYPGITPACPRCCQTSRYEAYLNNSVKKVDNVSSGCPLSATKILNAYKLEIAEELLFYHEEGSAYYDKLDSHANTNLLFVRLSQDIPNGMIGSVMDRATSYNGKAIIGSVFWDTITPDTDPECPLCHGTGDLRNVRSLQLNTREIV